ncbi:CotH kinase family protein [Bacteroides sp. OttesenSCG-928-J23]|nr:CotH kinase family protein [Bacteroides sp. OttesenSCG-928-N06]MDL2247645.1 CotH kinase family protein [Bacteroides sp. OttesenSCG-928-J23]MDL2305815.1 CotH kinase family protein [Bacteroides sp. OttesenSCG-928-D19]
MIKQLLSISAAFLLIQFSLSAQESTKLTGTIIGTKECVDYDNNNIKTTTVNTAANLFDGNFDTYFATWVASGGWAGLDLGQKHVITAIAYSPRKNWGKRTVLGLFEGANTPDFIDAVPLFIIDEKPQQNILTKQEADCSRGFRYVRYVGPHGQRCNIAELEFYGYKSDGDNSRLMQLTNIPTITIHTKNAQDIVEKEVYIDGVVSVISKEGTEIYTGDLGIRGRGNASWGFDKKPYRMKLKEKTNLLGNPAKEKSWTLINNHGDKTLMRNLIAFDLSRRLELAYTSVGMPVDVILNGEYKGCYQLCDQIQVATGRVEIDKKTGTFIEIDAYASSEPEGEWFSSNPKNIPVTIKHPEDDVLKERYNSIKSHFGQMVASVFAANYTDPIQGFRRYIDTESFIRHFLVGEISGNTDTYWSVYMYRKNDKEDTYYTGPVWDFDLAFENDNRTYPINNKYNWIHMYGSAAEGMRDFMNRLRQDKAFANDIKTIYAKYRDSGALSAEALIATVDKYEEEMNRSQRLNFMRWPILNQMIHQNFQALGSYSAEVDVLRQYITKRMEWMDKKLEYIPSSIVNGEPSAIAIYSDKNRILIEGITAPTTIHIYDISGREVYSEQAQTNLSVTLPQGTYIVRVDGKEEAQSETVKCIIAD